jgi:hypothetical protein
MKKIIFSLFCLLACIQAFPQQSISGTIIDQSNGQPVTFAQVIVKGTELGATTDQNGIFSIKNVSFPFTLVVSDIRYHTQQIRVQNSPIRILLKPKVYELDQVVIRPEDIERVLQEPIFSVIDYGFYDDLIVMAVMKNRKTKAYIRVQERGGKLVLEKRLPFVPEHLFEDCLGNLHLLSADSAYQLYYDYVNLHLLYPQSRQYLLSQLEPCKAYFAGKAYFQVPTRRGLIQNYLSVREGEKKLLYQLADSSKLEYLNKEYDLHYFLALKTKKQEPFVKLTVNQINDRLPEFQDMIGKDWLDNQILSAKYAPILLLKDHIGIFNFEESQVLTFGEDDALIAKKKMSFHQEEGWTKEVMVDPANGYVYAPTEIKGEYNFMRIDPSTMRIKRFIPIKNHDFIKNYQVRDGYIYFIDRNLQARDSQTYSLYRVRI